MSTPQQLPLATVTGEPIPVPVAKSDPEPITLTLVIKVSGQSVEIVKAMDPVALSKHAAVALVEAINKAGETPAPKVDAVIKAERLWKKAIIRKAEGESEERYVLGVVMEPDSVDTYGHTETAEEIRKAAFAFMEAYRGGGDAGHMGLMHKKIVDDKVAILECYIQKSDETIEGELVKAGSWMMATRVMDDDMWEQVKKGELTGFSIGGTAVITEVAA